MKFVGTTDTHFRATAENRKDNYLASLLANMRYILASCIELDVKLVVHAGDFGDFYNWGQSSPTALISVIQLLREFKDNDIEFVCIAGQHDMQNHNIDSWKQHTLGVLYQAGLLNVLSAGEAYKYADPTTEEAVVVYGFPYGATDEFLSGSWKPEKKLVGYPSVALVHASVGGEETQNWTSIKSHKPAGTTFALFGDIHKGFEPYTAKSGTICVNPGPPDYRSVTEIDKPRQFALFDTKQKSVELFDIPTPPVEALFDLDSRAKEKDNSIKDAAVDFVVTTRSKVAHLTPAEMIKEAANKMNVSDEVVMEVLPRL